MCNGISHSHSAHEQALNCARAYHKLAPLPVRSPQTFRRLALTRHMVRILAVVALVWVALLPPLFTNGACTAEFDHEASQLGANQKSLASPTLAQAYWSSRQIPISVVSPEQCRHARPRFMEVCGSGVLVYAVVPVQNPICRFYRDVGIRVQLQYDDRNRLTRIVTDMNPFRSLPLPWLGVTLHWGR